MYLNPVLQLLPPYLPYPQFLLASHPGYNTVALLVKLRFGEKVVHISVL